MKSHHSFLSCVLFLVLAAASGCQEKEPGKYVYANFTTAEVEDSTAPGGDVDPNPNVEHDILLIIVDEPNGIGASKVLHWSSRQERVKPESWPKFLEQCDIELKQRCSVNLPPLDGMTPGDFISNFEELMNTNQYLSESGGTTVGSTSTLQDSQDYKFTYNIYSKRDL